MPEISHNLNHKSSEHGETIPAEALKLHEVTKNTIASELGIDSQSAELKTGKFFVDKVDLDIYQAVPHNTLMTDVDAALISGGAQLETDHLLSANEQDKEALLHNPIIELESTHPNLVTEAVTELAGDKKTSKLAQFVAVLTDKIKTLVSRATPVIAPTGTVMSLHSAKKYAVFAKAVGEARKQPTGDPYENYFHSSPTLEQFKEWKKTGIAQAGIAPPHYYDTPDWWDIPDTVGQPSSTEPQYSISRWEKDLMGPVAPSWDDTLHNEDFLLPTDKAESAPDLPTSYYQVTQSHEEAITINPVEASAVLGEEDAIGRLEHDRTVKRAPRLAEQIQDMSRTNTILYIHGQDRALFTKTSQGEYRSNRESISEQSALRQLYDFFETVATSESSYADKARRMQEQLTFIGEKEYKEAVAGIASYWKSELNKNESLKIFAIAGEIAKSGGYEDAQGSLQVKSDDFLLENILSHFSEEDLAKYGDRVIVDHDDLVDYDAKDLKVVLLDDWTISGSQLTEASKSFARQYPHLASSVEIQLIAANEERVKHGLRGYDSSGRRVDTPVRAYYTAHHSEHGLVSKAHITGFHSSVDYDFEVDIVDMVSDMRSYGYDIDMVAPTNIVRPYRYDGVSRDSFIHRERVRARSHQRNRERVLT